MAKTATTIAGGFTVRVDDVELERRFREAAAKADLTPSQILRNAIRDYVNGDKPRRRQLAGK